MNFNKLLIIPLLIATGANTLYAQKKKEDGKNPLTTVPTVTAAKKPETPKKGPKPYKEVVDSTAVTQKGMMTVHKMDDKYLFEIPDSLLGRDIITVTRYVKTPAAGGCYGGEEVNTQVIRWEKGLTNNLLLKSITQIVTSPDEDKPIAVAVANSNADPIIANLEIKAFKKDSSGKKIFGYVVDVTSILDADIQTFSLTPVDKQLLNIVAFQKDRSFIQKISSYPGNVEVKTAKTFSTTPPRINPVPSPIPPIGINFPAGYNAGVVTIEMNTSFLLLPKNPMRKRLFDARVGYFARAVDVFGENSHKAKEDVYAVRWKLEPKSKEDAEKQKQGMAIEPKKPIVYYIDPATPVQWRKYLKQGVDDW
ncbi:MAG: DUF5117 domain-containing protein, partial [Leadbetterella sp.]